ncbi:UNVERIFIED_CONTAM: hypothetical protein FKN15_030831 [Acipenser sinensis]
MLAPCCPDSIACLLHAALIPVSPTCLCQQIRLKEIFETATEISLVLELVTGGELFDRIVQRGYYSERDAAHVIKQILEAVAVRIVQRGYYSERDAAHVIKQILEAVAYLHENGVVHRDLKPENLLYADLSPDASLKIADFGLSKIVDEQGAMKTVCGTPGYCADFGLSKIVDEQGAMKTVCGTPGYCAPEILRGNAYGPEVDMWSVGVISYILLCGFEPFFDPRGDQYMYSRILSCDYEFISPWWDEVSLNAKDLVCKLIVLDPQRRLSVQQALQHPWVSGKAARFSHMDTTQRKLQEFNARRKLKLAVLLGSLPLELAPQQVYMRDGDGRSDLRLVPVGRAPLASEGKRGRPKKFKGPNDSTTELKTTSSLKEESGIPRGRREPDSKDVAQSPLETLSPCAPRIKAISSKNQNSKRNCLLGSPLTDSGGIELEWTPGFHLPIRSSTPDSLLRTDLGCSGIGSRGKSPQGTPKRKGGRPPSRHLRKLSWECCGPKHLQSKCEQGQAPRRSRRRRETGQLTAAGLKGQCGGLEKDRGCVGVALEQPPVHLQSKCEQGQAPRRSRRRQETVQLTAAGLKGQRGGLEKDRGCVGVALEQPPVVNPQRWNRSSPDLAVNSERGQAWTLIPQALQKEAECTEEPPLSTVTFELPQFDLEENGRGSLSSDLSIEMSLLNESTLDSSLQEDEEEDELELPSFMKDRACGSFSGSLAEYCVDDISYPVRREFLQGPSRMTFPSNLLMLEEDNLDCQTGGPHCRRAPSKKLLPDRSRAARDKANEKLVQYIVKARGVEKHLQAIIAGRKASRWLAEFLHRSRFLKWVDTYLEDDAQLEVLVNYLQSVCESVQNTQLSVELDRIRFILDVLLPEVGLDMREQC